MTTMTFADRMNDALEQLGATQTGARYLTIAPRILAPERAERGERRERRDDRRAARAFKRHSFV